MKTVPYNLHQNPELYTIGRGEQGVLSVEPLKSEILPNWRFKDHETATESSKKIWSQFQGVPDEGRFCGGGHGP